MIIKKTFGVILLLLGLLLAFGLLKDSRLMLFGSKIKADVIGIESVKNKRFCKYPKKSNSLKLDINV
jgi:hypothetical protein